MASCLAAGRSVVLAGDLNIAPFANDHCDYVNAPARSAHIFLEITVTHLACKCAGKVCCFLTCWVSIVSLLQSRPVPGKEMPSCCARWPCWENVARVHTGMPCVQGTG